MDCREDPAFLQIRANTKESQAPAVLAYEDISTTFYTISANFDFSMAAKTTMMSY